MDELIRDFKGFAIGLAFFIVLCGMAWGGYVVLYRAFGPQEEAARRLTFEQSKAFRQGSVQELQNMQFEYVKADAAHKDALASIILHRAADIDIDALPYDLRSFIGQLRRERGTN